MSNTLGGTFRGNLSNMGETIITSDGDGELGAAAVAAAQAAGAADANATDAKATAERAEALAEEAARAAQGAQSASYITPTYEEARRIAREESLSVILELDTLAKAAPPEEPTPAVVCEEVNVEAAPEVEPPSVAKANKDGGEKTRFLDKWIGKL